MVSAKVDQSMVVVMDMPDQSNRKKKKRKSLESSTCELVTGHSSDKKLKKYKSDKSKSNINCDNIDDSGVNNIPIKKSKKDKLVNGNLSLNGDSAPVVNGVIDNDNASPSKRSKKHKSKKKKNVDSKSEQLSVVSTSNERTDSNVVEPSECDDDCPESVDSGCVPDRTVDNDSSSIDWDKIKDMLLSEHKFVNTLLHHLPPPAPIHHEELLALDQIAGESKKKRTWDDSSDDEDDSPRAKKAKYGDRLPDTTRCNDYEELRERWTTKLQSLSTCKNQNTQKREKKALKRKLQLLEKRKVKNKKIKLKVQNGAAKPVKKEKDGKANQKNIYNTNGQLVFSKFDFGSAHIGKPEEKTKKPDLKHALKQVLKKNAKVKSLVKDGKLEAAAHIKENSAWQGALSRAQGEKVRDNPELLKKSLKKKDNKKKVSQQKWDDRKKKLDKKVSEKQTKRNENLKTRKNDVLKNKMKKMKAKGHIVPGF